MIYQDLKYAVRQLAKHPGYTLVAVLTLGLGIGANTAIFSVVDGVLLKPLPYRQPERLVVIEGMGYKGELRELRRRASTMDVAAYVTDEASLTGSGEPARLTRTTASAGFFQVLGAAPLLGREFAPGDEAPGAEPVVVLSNGFWREHLGAAGDVIGRSLVLDGVRRTIVGVLPPTVRFPDPATQVWVPLVLDVGDPVNLWSTGGTFIARLRPGATLEAARGEVRVLAPRMRELFPWRMGDDYGKGATVAPLRARMVADVRPTLLVLLGAVGLVLLMACANLANLALARMLGRRRDIAVRSALGAGRGRLVRQLLTESLVLGAVGGAVGLGVAFWTLQALLARLPADVPRVASIGIDGRVLVFTAALSALTGVLFGVLPAIETSAVGAGSVWLKEGGRAGAGARQRRLTSVLAASQIALAVALVTSAALLLKSFWKLLDTDPGFRSERVVTATVSPPAFRYPDDVARRTFADVLLERVRALPAVTQAAVASAVPLGPGAYGSVFVIEGRPDPARESGDWPWSDVRAVTSPTFLRVLDIPLVAGRAFTAADRADAPDVVMVSSRLARRYWGEEDVVGRHLRFPGDSAWRTIVGVVDDVRWSRLSDEPSGVLYVPLAQGATGSLRLAVRTAGPPSAVAASLRAVVAAIDGDTPVSDVRTGEELRSSSVGRPRFTLLLLSGFAGVALILGVVGVYGVLAYGVGRRTREIGVRMALGARAGDVLRLVVGQGARLALAGVTLGVVLSLATSRALSRLLYGVEPTDPAVIATVAVALTATVLAAAYVPARRAARVAPMEALRNE